MFSNELLNAMTWASLFLLSRLSCLMVLTDSNFTQHSQRLCSLETFRHRHPNVLEFRMSSAWRILEFTRRRCRVSVDSLKFQFAQFSEHFSCQFPKLDRSTYTCDQMSLTFDLSKNLRSDDNRAEAIHWWNRNNIPCQTDIKMKVDISHSSLENYQH